MGFMPMNMSIHAREHEHSCPRTLVLLTDYPGHKCPNPRANLGKALGDYPQFLYLTFPDFSIDFPRFQYGIPRCL